MKAIDIRVGSALRFKPNRADAYGFARDKIVTVTEIRPHSQYKTVWIWAGKDCFKSQDFAGHAKS